MKSGDRVAVSWLHPAETITPHFVASLDRVRRTSHRVVDAGGLPAGANITSARNRQVQWFLDETRAEWLWIVDSDMAFDGDTLERLCESADDRRCQIVGGLCFALLTDLKTGLEYPAPTMFLLSDTPGELLRCWDWPASLCEVDATGAACLLVHRSVCEQMRDAHPGPWSWFREQIVDGRPMSEDITFCLRARSLGYSVWVDTRVEIDHMKLLPVNAGMYRAWRAGPGFAATVGDTIEVSA